MMENPHRLLKLEKELEQVALSLGSRVDIGNDLTGKTMDRLLAMGCIGDWCNEMPSHIGLGCIRTEEIVVHFRTSNKTKEKKKHNKFN